MWPIGGVLSSVARETVTLLGSSGSPTSKVYPGFSETGETANIYVQLTASSIGALGSTRGTVEWDGYMEGDQINLTSQWHDWVDPRDFQDGPYYLQWTDTGDDSPPAFSHAEGPDNWHTLSNGGANFWWRQSHNGPITKWTTIKIEIATDSGGTNIIATGYYRFGVSVTQ
jgi:hypothetical protein